MRPWISRGRQHRHRHKSRPSQLLSPPAVLASGFALLILIGTCLLKLPWATRLPLSWLEALFTATSAVTVTGLAVVDTGTEFTRFGDVIIMLLVQLGGLGFMTFSVITALALGARLGLKHSIIAQEALNQSAIADVKQAAKIVIKFSLIIELFGMLLLAVHWYHPKGWADALFEAAFYSISAFNNAGFGLEQRNMSNYVGDIHVNLVMCFLFVVGGLGFAVLADLWAKRRWRQLRPYTKMMLSATLCINIVAIAVFALLEYDNPSTLGQLNFQEKTLASIFQALSPRTAGFNTVDISALRDESSIFIMLLMFIGGGSMSTASGIKVGTFVVLIFATYAFLRQREEVVIAQRRLNQQQILKALAIAVLTVAVIFGGIFLLSISEDAEFLDISFEVVSAVGTVGLSRGLTTELSHFGQLVVILLMFAGRLGPLTLIWLLATPHKRQIRYPAGEFQIG
ncbi:TrkH family potassium uptake protein [Agaribacterium haliotis]|uniref:TrkH family potassium uptake protein n=1 Tax=Agaribacterium haliotis TaxID=2013869 RepID=UPI000BB535DE|nr:TrkH family potassium uptake protein [Agaribacterium haliotis]